MSESMHVIICTFDASEANAVQIKRALEVWDRNNAGVHLDNIAIVQKNADGQISLRETRDIHQELSDIAGVISGSVAWLVYAIAGSLGPVASQMAQQQAQQGVTRLVGDMGFSDEVLTEIGAALDAGSFALITAVPPAEQPLVIAELEQLGGTITQQLVPPEVLARLVSQDTARNP